LSTTTSKIFSNWEPSIPLAVLMKMLVAENMEVSAFRFLPQTKAFYTNKACFGQSCWIDTKKQKAITWFEKEEYPCKLRKTHRAKKLKEVRQLDSNRLIRSCSSSFNVDTSRFLGSVDRNSKHGSKGRTWNSKEKFLAVSILKCSPRSYAFLCSVFPLCSRTLHSLLICMQFKSSINAYVFSILKEKIQTMSDKFNMCCLMFDKMSIRRLTVLEALRTLEAMAGQAILHIMPWSSCSMVYLNVKGTSCFLFDLQ
jgi:hypothetical protein